MKNYEEVAKALLAGKTLVQKVPLTYYCLNGDGDILKTYGDGSKGVVDCIAVKPIDLEIKSPTILTKPIEIPEPERNALKSDQLYFFVDFYAVNNISCDKWDNFYAYHEQRLKKGIIHLTRNNAILHAEALLSLTKEK